MPEVKRINRPLSPHLTIYRPQWTSMTSILTRITGNALIVGAALVVWWLIALSAGPDAFAIADVVITSWVGDVIMVLSLWALWYHLLAGVRHLVWDSGRMLDVAVAELAGKVITGLSVVLTVATVLILQGY